MIFSLAGKTSRRAVVIASGLMLNHFNPLNIVVKPRSAGNGDGLPVRKCRIPAV
jgi:hypothetical protein